jgi:hypothetical protein
VARFRALARCAPRPLWRAPAPPVALDVDPTWCLQPGSGGATCLAIDLALDPPFARDDVMRECAGVAAAEIGAPRAAAAWLRARARALARAAGEIPTFAERPAVAVGPAPFAQSAAGPPSDDGPRRARLAAALEQALLPDAAADFGLAAAADVLADARGWLEGFERKRITAARRRWIRERGALRGATDAVSDDGGSVRAPPPADAPPDAGGACELRPPAEACAAAPEPPELVELERAVGQTARRVRSAVAAHARLAARAGEGEEGVEARRDALLFRLLAAESV